MNRMPADMPDDGWKQQLERALLESRPGARMAAWLSAYREFEHHRALVKRRRSAVLADAFYRALAGRPADRRQRAEFRRRAAEGAPVVEIAEAVLTSEEGARKTVDGFGAVLRSYLSAQFDTETGKPFSPRLVFLHIPKTGGTSLSDVLAHWVGPSRARVNIFLDDLVLCPPPVLATSAAISGHLPYAALGLIPGPFRTMVVLRDPFERTLSHYGHLKTRDPHLRDLSLENFVFSDDFHSVAGNFQTRYLAYDNDIANAWRTWSPEHVLASAWGDRSEPLPLAVLFDNTRIPQPGEELLAEAKRNLEAIDFVGVTQSLNRLTRQVATALGFPQEDVPQLNSAPPSFHVGDVSSKIRRRIEKNTALDRELYDLAKQRAHS